MKKIAARNEKSVFVRNLFSHLDKLRNQLIIGDREPIGPGPLSLSPGAFAPYRGGSRTPARPPVCVRCGCRLWRDYNAPLDFPVPVSQPSRVGARPRETFSTKPVPNPNRETRLQSQNQALPQVRSDE